MRRKTKTDPLAVVDSFFDEIQRKRDQPPVQAINPLPPDTIERMRVKGAIHAVEIDGDTSHLIKLLRTRNKYALADEGFLNTVANALEGKYKRATHRPAKWQLKWRDANIVAHLLFFSGATGLPIAGSGSREEANTDTADLLAPLFHLASKTLRNKWDKRDKKLFDSAREELLLSAGRGFSPQYQHPFRADSELTLLLRNTPL